MKAATYDGSLLVISRVLVAEAKSTVKIEASIATSDPDVMSHISWTKGKQGSVVVESEVEMMESVQESVVTAFPIFWTKVLVGRSKNTVLSIVKIALKQGFISSTSKSYVAVVSEE